MRRAVTYDLEKYRDKRERVLGVRKRGLGFAGVMGVFSLVVVFALGLVIVPRAVNFLQNRQLEDAIYKFSAERNELNLALEKLKKEKGIKGVSLDVDGSRVVVTFNRELIDTARLSSYFLKEGLKAVLLNEIGHEHRLHTMKKEAAMSR